jgi:hypothetical protein
MPDTDSKTMQTGPASRRFPWSLGGWTAGVLILMAGALLLGGALAQWLMHRGDFFRWPSGTDEVWAVAKLDFGLLGAAIAGVAIVVAFRRQAERERASRRADAAARRAESAEARDETRAYIDRYGAAAGQLGDSKATVRLAGVYALASVADTWADQRQQSVDLLCAYLRMPYAGPSGIAAPDSTEITQSDSESRTTTVIRARHGEEQVRGTIVRVIADHLTGRTGTSWSDRDFDLSGSRLEGVDFTGAVFGGWVSFARARFVGEARFDGANFARAVSFRDASFGDSALSKPPFADASPADASFLRTHFSDGASFDRVTLEPSTGFSFDPDHASYFSFASASVQPGARLAGRLELDASGGVVVTDPPAAPIEPTKTSSGRRGLFRRSSKGDSAQPAQPDSSHLDAASEHLVSSSR